MKYIFYILFHFILFYSFSYCLNDKYYYLNSNWFCARDINVPVDGCLLSNKLLLKYNGYNTLPFNNVNNSQYSCLLNNNTNYEYLQDWIPATVPGTILSSLLNNNIINNPYYGINNQYIPDIYKTGISFYTFWFYTNFTFEFDNNHHYFLNFRGINYKADVFLNGYKVNQNTIEGMFLRHSFDITQYLSSLKEQELAVLVYPPNPPGNATTGQCGDGTIAKSITCQYMAGWDWVEPTRDRSTGIWDKVFITSVGDVKIINSHFISYVNGTRDPTNINQDPVLIEISTTLENLSNNGINISISWILTSISLNPLTYSDTPINLYIQPNTIKSISLPSYNIINPNLWWPNRIGNSSLYNIKIIISSTITSTIYDIDEYSVGLRSVYSEINSISGGREFYINGNKIYIVGANWISIDAMMRFNKTSSHEIGMNWYDQEVKMHADMNMNMIRVWGGGLLERPEFYDACDEYGLLVWQEFWITGDCNGAWIDPVKKDSRTRRRYYPDDYNLFIKSAKDAIILLRNHPSLCIWVGGNEWEPPSYLNESLTKLINKYDSTRNYIPSSLSEGLGPSDGPYGIQHLEWFYSASDTNIFNPEMGSIGMPVVETMRKIMNIEDLTPFGTINSVWQYHKFIPYYNANGSDGKIVADQIEAYGIPKTIEEYCFQAQLANYQQYKSLFEGRQEYMWNNYTGLLVWKSQNPWTGLRGQMYDWFGEQNAGFYGIKSALEPLHCQINLNTQYISIINREFTMKSNLLIIGTQYFLSSSGEYIENSNIICNIEISIHGNSIFNSDCKLLPIPSNSVSFIELRTINSQTNTLITNNFYWISGSPTSITAYSILQSLHISTIQVEIQSCNVMDDIVSLNLNITNINTIEQGYIAFFIRIQIVDNIDERILPIDYSDNYFSILPLNSKQINIIFKITNNWNIKISGWNINTMTINQDKCPT